MVGAARGEVMAPGQVAGSWAAVRGSPAPVTAPGRPRRRLPPATAGGILQHALPVQRALEPISARRVCRGRALRHPSAPGVQTGARAGPQCAPHDATPEASRPQPSRPRRLRASSLRCSGGQPPRCPTTTPSIKPGAVQNGRRCSAWPSASRPTAARPTRASATRRADCVQHLGFHPHHSARRADRRLGVPPAFRCPLRHASVRIRKSCGRRLVPIRTWLSCGFASISSQTSPSSSDRRRFDPHPLSGGRRR
jgi:hypothetical protein